MTKPLYPKEKTLFYIAFVIAALFWAGVVLATKGIILLLFPVFFLIYLFVQSGFISYMKGTGALVSDSQFPDIQQRAKECARKVDIKVLPEIYILHGNGLFNAFATRFLRKDYIILLSDVLDALEDHPDAINFYIGHEMGHIDRKHLLFEPFLSLALALPLLGAAYSRAREYTCDQYGAACCTPEAAQQGVALLAVGGKRYKTINIQKYLEQTNETSGFWMSFHELIASYPWLVKRFARIAPNFQQNKMPSRNPFAYLFAVFVPRMNVMSILIIYFLFVGLTMGGLLKGEELIANAAALSEANLEVAEDLEISAEDILSATVEEINKTAPQQLDEVTTLNQAYAENNNALVYDFSISMDKSEVDFHEISATVRSNSFEHWCTNGDTKIFRDQGIKIIYRYSDLTGQRLGDVIFELANPETCMTP